MKWRGISILFHPNWNGSSYCSLARAVRFMQPKLMYLIYVDESGDAGRNNSPTRYFVLSGLVIHEAKWRDTLNKLIDFRLRIRSKFGLLLKEEIHAGAMLSRPGNLVRIKRNDRLAIIRHFLDEIATIPDLRIISVRVDKQGKPPGYDVFENAWRVLIQRFENTLVHQNFPGCQITDHGIIFCDETDAAKLRALYRKMRVFNPIPNDQSHANGYRQMPLMKIVEDPSVRDSNHSYFIQAVDSVAWAFYQRYAPSSFVRRKGAKNYFTRLGPVLSKTATRRNSFGIVEL